MSDGTHISWSDATWNPVTGCTKVSAGCDHCYIDRTPPFRMNGRKFDKPGIGGTTGVQLHPERLDQPLHWRKPRRIFVNSLSDLFHDAVPTEFIARVFAVMAQTPQHTYQILTKRPARMRALVGSTAGAWHPFLQGDEQTRFVIQSAVWPLPNVWLGVSTENQAAASFRIPLLLKTPTAVRWISAEPLLGPLDLTDCRGIDVLSPDWCGGPTAGSGAPHPLIDWVVAGGESGPGARPMHPDWARSLRDQCAAAGVPFHLKQAGSVLARQWGCADRTGRVPAEWPESFGQEYPDVA